MAKRRKVGNLLALAVLALATEAPTHPYEMATKLRERGKDQSIKINWGSLYTVVGNLEKHGLIQAAETEREGRRPERTRYTITEAGLAELKDWMRELLGTYEKDYRRFEAALTTLPILPPGEVMDLLTAREQAIRAQIAKLTDQYDRHIDQIPRIFLIETEYDLTLLRAEADWVAALRAEIQDGSFPGLRFWRSFHELGIPPNKVAEMFERGELPEDLT